MRYSVRFLFTSCEESQTSEEFVILHKRTNHEVICLLRLSWILQSLTFSPSTARRNEINANTTSERQISINLLLSTLQASTFQLHLFSLVRRKSKKLILESDISNNNTNL